MTASILVCHYIKHGMTCGLGGAGMVLMWCFVLLIGGSALAVIDTIRGTRQSSRARRIDHKGAG